MGIRVFCPNGHRLNLKSHLAGKQGICPHCGTTVTIPTLEKAEELGMLKNPRAAGREQSLSAGAYRANGSNGSAVGLAEAPTKASAADVPCEPNLASPYARTNGSPSNGSGANGSSSAIHSADRNGSAIDDGGIDITAPTNGSRSASNSTIVAAAAAPAEEEVDPIAENPQAVWYVRTPQGGQYGPAAGDIMRKWIAEGRVQADFWVWREGWGDWQKASSSIPSLKKPAAALAPAPLAAPVAPAPARSEAVARTNAPASTNGHAGHEPSATARPARRRKGGIHPLAILAVVGLGFVCLSLLGVLVAMIAGAL